MTTFGDVPVTGSAPPAAEGAQSVKRWLYVWIAVGLIVVLVVIGFLFAIANSVESINAGLAGASPAVANARGDVKPLPAYIEDVNARLGRVDASLKPIPRQARRIIANLTTINGTLVHVNGTLDTTEGRLVTGESRLRDIHGSLVDTSNTLDATEGHLRTVHGTLVSTEGALGDTEGTLNTTEGTLRDVSTRLVSTRTLAGRIHHRLVLSELVRSAGTGAIWRRVRYLNGGRFVNRTNKHGLDAVNADTGDIVASLGQINKHLESICKAPAGAGSQGTTPVNTPTVPTVPGGQTPQPTPPC